LTQSISESVPELIEREVELLDRISASKSPDELMLAVAADD
jgi:hypothetical protein